jgi:GAF domain-containing protein
LRRALTELAMAVLTEHSLRGDLERLVRLATKLLPNASGATIALLIEGLPTTVAVSDHVAFELDLVQYNAEEGPCLTALHSGTVRIAFLPEDERFPHFAIGAADQRIKSVLSIPIRHGDRTIGTLNVYSRVEHAFDAASEETGSVIGAEAANAIAKSELLASATDLRERLQFEYDADAMIARAEGILMALESCNQEQARGLIQNAADANQESMLQTAERILNQIGQTR